MSAILEGTPDKKLALVTGRAYPEQAHETAKYLGIDVLETTAYDFANGEMYVRYTEPVRDDSSAQFDVSDTRTLDEVVNWLMKMGFIPSFCTACYRAGRTGDRFMSLLKSGQIVNCCQPNALMTLKEYLEDYASPETKEIGESLIAKEIRKVPNEKVRERAIQYLEELKEGKRDFRF